MHASPTDAWVPSPDQGALAETLPGCGQPGFRGFGKGTRTVGCHIGREAAALLQYIW